MMKKPVYFDHQDVGWIFLYFVTPKSDTLLMLSAIEMFVF